MAGSVGNRNIKITLDGKNYELVPSLGAAQAISRVVGGLRTAAERVSAIDLDAVTAVIRAGLGPQVVKELGDRFSELVYQAGMTDRSGKLVEKCIDYLTVLCNPVMEEVPADQAGDRDSKDPH